MNRAALELAYRTAMTAGPVADSLAGDVLEIAYSMRHGELARALEALEVSSDRLGRFLTFLVIASEILSTSNPSLGAVLGDYNRRLLSIVHTIESALAEQDMVGLALALEHGLGRNLGEYQRYAADVRRSIVKPLAA